MLLKNKESNTSVIPGPEIVGSIANNYLADKSSKILDFGAGKVDILYFHPYEIIKMIWYNQYSNHPETMSGWFEIPFKTRKAKILFGYIATFL